MDRYNPERDVTPAFIERVAAWIAASGEVLVILRYLRAAGRKAFALCRTLEEFETIVRKVRTGTDIIVFRDPQLPIRGVVTEGLIASALAAVADGEEYLVISLETEDGTRISRFDYMRDCIGELRELLDELVGDEIALGVCPNFNAPDHDDLVSASKGGIDGPR